MVESKSNFSLPEEVGESLGWLESQVDQLMAGEHRREAFFRALLVGTELGDAVKYITHDPNLNPSARPHGSQTEEVLAYGQLLAMVFSLMWARKIDLKEALELGLKNWWQRDWQKREGVIEGPIQGLIAYPGISRGIAYVVSETNPLESIPKGIRIVVAPFLTAEQMMILRERLPLALITDHGGTTSHPSILSREFQIIALVGTGNATNRIPHGAEVLVEAIIEKGSPDEKGTVQIVPKQ